jgi:uncharacterized protein
LALENFFIGSRNGSATSFRLTHRIYAAAGAGSPAGTMWRAGSRTRLRVFPQRQPDHLAGQVGCSGRVAKLTAVLLSGPAMIRTPPCRATAKTQPMHHDSYSDAFLREILTRARVIAVVGASPRPQRPSHGVMRYLQQHGYRTIPVNPFAAGGTILGERCYARLADVPVPVDMVDVFRRSDAAGGVVDEAIAIGTMAIWMQLGVRDDAAAARAAAQGIKVVMNRCPAIEIPRLGLSPARWIS